MKEGIFVKDKVVHCYQSRFLNQKAYFADNSFDMEFLRVTFSLLFFVLVFCIGFLSLKKDTLPKRHIAEHVPRNLQTDYSYLSGGSLKKAVINRLLMNSYIDRQSDDFRVHLAHFQMTVDGKKHSSVCDYFKTVQITFQAEGIAVSGEKPLVVLQAPCILGEENYIQSLPISTPGFFKANSWVRDFVMSGQGQEPHFIPLWSMVSSTPYQWFISEIALIPQSESDEEITISSNQLWSQSAKKAYFHKFYSQNGHAF